MDTFVCTPTSHTGYVVIQLRNYTSFEKSARRLTVLPWSSMVIPSFSKKLGFFQQKKCSQEWSQSNNKIQGNIFMPYVIKIPYVFTFCRQYATGPRVTFLSTNAYCTTAARACRWTGGRPAPAFSLRWRHTIMCISPGVRRFARSREPLKRVLKSLFYVNMVGSDVEALTYS